MALRRGDGSVLPIGDGRTAIMGILNVTPDSFSDGGRHLDAAAARRRADQLLRQGADILDVGAESTRPGAAEVPADEEWRRLQDLLLPLLAERPRAVLSVDTRHLSTAARAADAGVRLWNLPFPHHLPEQAPLPEVRAVLARFDGVVLMHSRGTPETMAGLTHYEGALVEAVAGELLAMTERLCGEDPALLSRILYDPGLGFAKQAGQSLLLLGQVGRLRRRLGRPLLVGASRKSFLGQATGLPVEERLIPSVVAAALAAAQGADVVRVHDVAETRAAVLMAQAVMRSGEGGGA